MLMLSGVLKHVADRDPSRRFNLIRRSGYQAILGGHPAIAGMGFPPRDAEVQHVTYWSMEPLGPGRQRPFQILARGFGLATPIEERLFVPGDLDPDPLLASRVPWRRQNVLIAPASDSPRKMAPPELWHALVDRLRADGVFVAQAGRTRDLHIRNAYSLLGLTTPRQIVALLSRFDVVVTPDNFIMHASHLKGVPAVVLWGPTVPEVYGWPGQIHLRSPKGCDLPEMEDCIGPKHSEGGKLYGTPCPRGHRHCMRQFTPEMLYDAVKRAFLLRTV
jgi:ADP-heptose:LPS heptosyltransferase